MNDSTVILKTREKRASYNWSMWTVKAKFIMEHHEVLELIDELEKSLDITISLDRVVLKTVSHWILLAVVETDSKAYNTLIDKGWKINK